MKKNIRMTLAAAGCALLGSSPVLAEDKHDVGDWDISAALLFYNESDRVQAIEPIITAKKQLDTDETLVLKLTVDSLTGASASGAVPTNRPQTFTTPSGNGTYVIGGNETPLDDSFLDTRYAINAAWEKPVGKDLTMVLGGNYSYEYDYTSISVNTSLAKDINEGNTTLSAGLSVGFDTVDPVGGQPIAFAAMQERGGALLRNGTSDNKTLLDIVFGVTQIIDKNSLFQINYSVSQSDGYLTDPYKVISVVDASTGIPLFNNVSEPNLPTVLFENRPDTRLKHSLFGQYKRYLGGDVLDTSYRFMIDDWGIDSHTIDLRYRWQLTGNQFIQPHVRLYQQSAADFYTPFFVDGTQPTAGNSAIEASADYRLGEFTAYTVGLEYGQEHANNSWSVALEYYLQSGSEPDNKFGELSNQELYPDVDALMVRFIYDF